jgi:hypothetical protein
MATTTTNFGWDIPQSTDLVKDGATAIAALGQDIDTALVDLKGGTTGQILAKASNTDLDYSWVAQDDPNAIQNTQLTAKGSLISAFSAGTPATLTVGTNGQILTADSTAATGIKWATAAASGLTLITTASPSATATVNIDNCFSSTYQTYKIFYNLSATAGAAVKIRLRVGGVNATTNYTSQYLAADGIGVTAGRDTTNQAFVCPAVRSSGRAFAEVNISNPFATAETSYFTLGQDPQSGACIENRAGGNTNATSYDGLSLFVDSGNITGSIRVYGVQNS